MAYLRPLNRDEMDEQLQALYTHYENSRGFMPNSIRTMARRPNIAKAFGALNQAVLYEGEVDTELKMLISLMSSVSAGCRYCQSHMANLASIYKASDKKIAAVWDFESSDLFNEQERCALRFSMNASKVPNEVSAENFVDLKKYYNEEQIVEIVASVALFGFLNRWNDTMATELEDLPTHVAERTIGNIGWNAGKHGKIN